MSNGDGRPDMATVLAIAGESKESNMELVGVQYDDEPIEWLSAGPDGPDVIRLVADVREQAAQALGQQGAQFAAGVAGGAYPLGDEHYDVMSAPIGLAADEVAKLAYALPQELGKNRDGDTVDSRLARYGVAVAAMNVLLGLVEHWRLKIGESPLR